MWMHRHNLCVILYHETHCVRGLSTVLQLWDISRDPSSSRLNRSHVWDYPRIATLPNIITMLSASNWITCGYVMCGYGEDFSCVLVETELWEMFTYWNEIFLIDKQIGTTFQAYSICRDRIHRNVMSNKSRYSSSDVPVPPAGYTP